MIQSLCVLVDSLIMSFEGMVEGRMDEFRSKWRGVCHAVESYES